MTSEIIVISHTEYITDYRPKPIIVDKLVKLQEMRPSFIKGAFFGLVLSVVLWVGIIYGVNVLVDLTQVASESLVSAQ